MTRTGLVLANLKRHKRRSILTVLGMGIAIFLFVMLRSVLTTLEDSGNVGSERRLVVRNRIGIVFPLPIAYRTRLQNMEGVTGVTTQSWFGGTYIEPRNFFAQFAVDAATFLPLYPEIIVPEDQKEAFMNEQTAALVGRGLVERFGWKLGQTINLKATIYNPGQDWPFTIRAIYDSGRQGFPDNNMYFHYGYLEQGVGANFGQVGTFVVGIADPSQAADIAAAIDASYENSASATKTETEGAYNLGFVGLYGNIGFFLNTIGMAVVFAILLVVANTMAMSARERIPEVAVLKTLGFSDGSVFGFVLAEAFALALIGTLVGLGGAVLVFNLRNFDVFGFIPGMTVAGRTVALTLGITVLLALVSGLVPARAAGRLNVVEALRHVA
jgi:putative ABC transport system permease protein